MGEIADYYAERMLEDMINPRIREDLPKKTATEVAEERLADVLSDERVRKLNDGVMKW
jgi:hypothetical protein